MALIGSANFQCPRKECGRTDSLVCTTYYVAARAARSGNALVVVVAALRRLAAACDRDTENTIDAALSAHSQLTHDVSSVMSAAMIEF